MWGAQRLSLFCYALVFVLSSFAIVLKRKIEVVSWRLINFMIEQTNYIKQHFLQGVMFKISLVLISILRSTINDI